MTVDCPASDYDKCPVDHTKINPKNLIPRNLENGNDPVAKELPTHRIISSIPRGNADENWKYPSEQMFYNAMKKKGHNPNAEDMKYVLFMHNVVNEKCWVDILKWEKQLHGEVEKERKLVRFMGKPKVPTIKSKIRKIMG
jgi:cytochrome c heme-lyase